MGIIKSFSTNFLYPYAAEVFLVLECVIIGSLLFLTTDLFTVTSLTSSMAGSLNIVFSNKDSIIDLNPLAPVFLFIAFLLFL